MNPLTPRQYGPDTYPPFQYRQLSLKVDGLFLRSTPIQTFSLEIFAVRVNLLPQRLDGVLI